VLTKELQYVGRFEISGLEDGEEIIKMSKIGPNVGLITKTKIGFARFIDGKQQ